MGNYNFGNYGYNNYGHNFNNQRNDYWNNVFSGVNEGIMVLAVILIIIAIAVAIFMIIANCKMFTKAGEQWWKALIPFYSTFVETRFVGLGWWWFALFMFFGMLTAYATDMDELFTLQSISSWAIIILSFNMNYNLAKKFGKSGGFAFLCTIIPVIGIPILAFGSSKYDENAKVDINGIFNLKR